MQEAADKVISRLDAIGDLDVNLVDTQGEQTPKLGIKSRDSQELTFCRGDSGVRAGLDRGQDKFRGSNGDFRVQHFMFRVALRLTQERSVHLLGGNNGRFFLLRPGAFGLAARL